MQKNALKSQSNTPLLICQVVKETKRTIQMVHSPVILRDNQLSGGTPRVLSSNSHFFYVSGIRGYAGGRALDSFLQKRVENIKKSRPNPPGFAPVEGSLQNRSGGTSSCTRVLMLFFIYNIFQITV